MFKEKGTRNHDSANVPLADTDFTRKLTIRDVALGFGRKATGKELEAYLEKPHGATVPLAKAIERIKGKLQKKRQQRKK